MLFAYSPYYSLLQINSLLSTRSISPKNNSVCQHTLKASIIYFHHHQNFLVHQFSQSDTQATHNYQPVCNSIYVQVPIQVTFNGHTQVFVRRATWYRFSIPSLRETYLTYLVQLLFYETFVVSKTLRVSVKHITLINTPSKPYKLQNKTIRNHNYKRSFSRRWEFIIFVTFRSQRWSSGITH